MHRDSKRPVDVHVDLDLDQHPLDIGLNEYFTAKLGRGDAIFSRNRFRVAVAARCGSARRVSPGNIPTPGRGK